MPREEMSPAEKAVLMAETPQTDEPEEDFLPPAPPYEAESADLDDFDDDDDLNDTEVSHFGDPPLIGTARQATDIFGSAAETVGRATSPKLFASQSQFPTAVQFRVWRWENGIPVAIGAIDAEANEDDFVKMFLSAMPRAGDGRFQFRLRPVNQNGVELGKEFTVNISEHHAELRRLRSQQEDTMRNNHGHGHDPLVINQGAGGEFAEELGRVMEQALDSADRRNEALEATLREERERLREEEKVRTEERVRVAERSTEAVQKMTDRLMETDRLRSKEALESQKESSGMMLNTLTTVFSQQQAAGREQSERIRQLDEARALRDREWFAQQQAAVEDRRRAEREDYERRMTREREEAERKQAAEQARLELERQRIELQMQQRTKELELQRQTMAEAADRRLQAEKLEWERREAARRAEMEERRREDERRREQERRDYDARMAREREEAERRESRRREEIQLQLKQMEIQSQNNREHSERMMRMAQLEREAAREAAVSREKIEREAREAADRDRQRQHEMAMRELEMNKERDREHQERMLQLQKMGSSGVGGILEQLGMETPELMEKLFGGGGEGGGWADAIPKVLGSLGDIAKAASGAGGMPPGVPPVQAVPPAVLPAPVPDISDILGEQAMEPVQLPAPPPVEEVEAAVVTKKTEAPAQPAQPQLSPPQILARARKAGMSLLDQKKARKGLKALAAKMQEAPEDQWVALITEAITENFAIYQYIKAVTVRVAFGEATEDADFKERVIVAMKKSALVPDDLPYDESDYARLQEGEA